MFMGLEIVTQFVDFQEAAQERDFTGCRWIDTRQWCGHLQYGCNWSVVKVIANKLKYGTTKAGDYDFEIM